MRDPVLSGLYHHHESIERSRLDALTAAGRVLLEEDDDATARARDDVMTFIERYALPHMLLEEMELFPRVSAHGVPEAVVASFVRDHAALRSLAGVVLGAPLQDSGRLLVRFMDLFELHGAREEAVLAALLEPGALPIPRARAEVPRHYAFESIEESVLDYIPLDFRRKLAHAGVRMSLAAWSALDRKDRERLVAAAVETDEDAAMLARDIVVAANATGADVGAEVTLDTPVPTSAPPWSSGRALERLRDAAHEVGYRVDVRAWSALDDAERYALHDVATCVRQDTRLRSALDELGVGARASTR